MEPVMEAPAPPVAPPEEKAPPVEEAPPTAEAPPTGGEVLLAHANPEIVNMLKFVLSGANFTVISAADGVTAMMKALQEQPSVVVVDVRLPKIHGIEVMKRLGTRAETKDIKIILVGTKPESEVPPIKGAVGYIQEDRLQQGLVNLIKNVLEAPVAPAEPAAETKPAAAPKPAPPAADVGAERAQRFCRTVMADIDLYNKEKVAEAIRTGSFESVFAKEIKEGIKLYEMRIPEDVRSQADFYNEAVQAFIEKKQKQLGV
jgi:CheY-like chemotaxis protein